LAAVATSTTSSTTLAGLSFTGLDGIAATSRGLLCDAQKGFAFVVGCSQAKEFTLAHWLVNGADGGRLFVPCFGDGTVRDAGRGSDPCLRERQHRRTDPTAGNLTRHWRPGQCAPVDRHRGAVAADGEARHVCRPVADKPGGSAKQNGSPSPRQVSCTTRSPDRTVTR
jgi:hypothetical protein